MKKFFEEYGKIIVTAVVAISLIAVTVALKPAIQNNLDGLVGDMSNGMGSITISGVNVGGGAGSGSGSGSVTEQTYKLKTGLEFNALIPSTTTSVVFTDEAMPADVTLIDIDADGDGGVVAWLDGTTFKISTQKPGQKIIANENNSYMFCGGSSIGNKTTVTRNLTSITGLENMDTSNVTNMSYMFDYAGYDTTTWSIGDLSGWDTSNVTNMERMFLMAGYKATSWSVGDLSSWDTSNVTNMREMFNEAGKNATTWSIGDLSGWDTSKVTDMYGMFYNVGKNATYSLDLSGWNVNKVTSYLNFNKNVESKFTPPTWVN